MFKNASVMFLYAETSVHLGGGESLGAIDLAIQRERFTEFPVGASSGIKGAVRAWFEKAKTVSPLSNDNDFSKKIDFTFGQEKDSEYMGAASFSDARLLLFPVRSLVGVFAYLTCPMVLERLRRDLAIAGIDTSSPPTLTAQKGMVHGTNTNENKTAENKVILEEFVFNFQQSNEVQKLANWLVENALPNGNEYTFWKNCLSTHLLIVPDDDFKDFVKFSTEVRPRVKLGEGKSSDTSKGGNLFYQENLPSDCLMYSLVLSQDVLGERLQNNWGTADNVLDFLHHLDGKRLQIGGDESIGKGIMCVKFYQHKRGEKNEPNA